MQNWNLKASLIKFQNNLWVIWISLKDYANKDIVISGIATEYCVKNSVEEFLNSGRNIELLLEGLAYVDFEGHKKTIEELEQVVTVVK